MALGVTRHDWRENHWMRATNSRPTSSTPNTSGQGQNWIQLGCSMLERMNGLPPRERCFAGTHCYTWRSAQPFGHGAMVIHMLQRKHDSCKHNHRWMPCIDLIDGRFTSAVQVTVRNAEHPHMATCTLWPGRALPMMIFARRLGPTAWDLAHMSQQTCSNGGVQDARTHVCMHKHEHGNRNWHEACRVLPAAHHILYMHNAHICAAAGHDYAETTPSHHMPVKQCSKTAPRTNPPGAVSCTT